MICCPLPVLMQAGVDEIIVINTLDDLINFQRLLGDGAQFGIRLTFGIQPASDGLARAFIIGDEFLGDGSVYMPFGDTIFYGQGFSRKLSEARSRAGRATIFGYQVRDPEHFGVVEFGRKMRALSLEEKPSRPKSHFAVTGLYFDDNDVAQIAKHVKCFDRCELETTCFNQAYFERCNLPVEVLRCGFARLDTGSHEVLLEAAQFVEAIEKHQGYKIACLEENPLNSGWLSIRSGNALSNNGYGKYLNP